MEKVALPPIQLCHEASLELMTIVRARKDVKPSAMPIEAVPYPAIPFCERVVMIGEEDMNLWQKDVIIWDLGSLQDKVYREISTIRADNPVAMSIQIPLAFRFGGDETLMKRAKDAIAGAEGVDEKRELEVMYAEYFGPDKYCLSWNPSMNTFPSLSVTIQPLPENFESVKPIASRFIIALGLLAGIWIDVCDCRIDPPQLLFQPESLAKHPIMASDSSRFRHDVIWPLFGSVQNFWEALVKLFEETKVYAYVWPESHAMSIPQLRDYLKLHFPDDEEIVKLSYALEAIQGGYSRYTLQLTSKLEDGFKSHHVHQNRWL